MKRFSTDPHALQRLVAQENEEVASSFYQLYHFN